MINFTTLIYLILIVKTMVIFNFEKDSDFSYITHFVTTGDWQDIEIDLTEMYPSYRGRKLDKPNYPKINVEQIAFLIGNKKEQRFKLEIDKISFE